MFRFPKNKAISLKLKSKLLLSFMGSSTLILLFFALIFYRYTSNTLLEQSEQATLNSLRQLESNLTTVLDTVNMISNNILVSSYLSEEMKLEEIRSSDDVLFINDIYNFFSELMGSYDYIHSIVYYGDNGIIMGASSQKNFFQPSPGEDNFFYESSLRQELDEGKNSVICGGLCYSDFFPGVSANMRDVRYISLGRRLRTMHNLGGYVVVNIPESYIRSFYHGDSRSSSNESMLLDSHNTIISCGDKSLIGTSAGIESLDGSHTVRLTLEQGDNGELNSTHQIIYYPYNSYGLSIVYEIPYSTLFANITQLKILLITLLIVFLILALLISTFWIYTLTQPLNRLIEAMKTMGSGQLGIKLDGRETSDFKFLTDQFNQMSQNIQSLISENQAISEQRHELALQNLQTQLNPHFLYNTLNTIKWMAIVSKADNIAACVTALGNLLQPLFRNTKTTWPLCEELNYLKNYLCIMNYRTGEPVVFTPDIDPSILGCTVPKFILQPLLENAVSNFNPSSEIKNSISLTGSRSASRIVLLLQDNGLGIPAEKLTLLQNLLASNEDCSTPLDRASLPEGIGIGILNTNRRIKLQYGNSCGLTIDSSEGAGTAVTITLEDIPQAPLL